MTLIFCFILSGLTAEAGYNVGMFWRCPAITALVWSQQPSNTASTNAISPAITITAKDASGRVVNCARDTISIGLGTDPTNGSAKLTGTATQALVAGVATFANLSIDVAGIGYQLMATNTLVTSALSNAFNITTGVATKLVFLQNPIGGTIGATLSPTVSVEITDAGGNLVSSASDTILLMLNPNPTYLTGVTGVASSGGIASFSNIQVSTAGTGYILTASPAVQPYTSVGSSPFDIVSTTPVNLEVPVDFLDCGLGSLATGTISNGCGRFSFDSSYYDGTVSFTFEFVATNSDTAARTVALTDAANVIRASFSVPASTVTPQRFSTSFTPTSGPQNYKVKLDQSTSINQLAVTAGRVKVAQTGATRSRIYFPLTAAQNNVANQVSNFVDQAYSGTFGRNNTDQYLSWVYDLTHLSSTAANNAFTFESTLRSGLVGTTTSARLVDVTNGNAPVAGTTLSTTSNQGNPLKVAFSASASNFVPGHEYMVEIASSGIGTGAVTGQILRSGLWVNLVGITRAESHYRVLKQASVSSSSNPAYQRAIIDSSLFTNPSVYFRCYGFESAANNVTLGMLDTGVSETGTAGTAVTGSGISFTAAPAWATTGPLTVSNGNRFIPVITRTSGTADVTDCEVLLRAN